MKNPVGIPEDCGCGGPPSVGMPCGCCASTAVPTPRKAENAPGLPALRYRVGTYPEFRQAMLEAIRGKAPLSRWTSRRDDDWGVAVLDMWAYVGDVLTFYQERIVNEAFLRTATRRGSVLRLAALLDYRPGPGKSATVHLAFTVEKGKQVRVPAGVRVQSVPGQDEKPQKFEVEEPLLADARLNEVRVHGVPVAPASTPPSGASAVLSPDAPPGIAPGEKMIVLRSDNRIEVKDVVSVAASDSGPVLSWTPRVQGTGASARRLLGQYPLLGPSVPPFKFDPTPKSSSDPTPVGYAAVTYDQAAGGPILLDGVHKDVAVGAAFVLTYPSGRITGRVSEVTFGVKEFGGVAVPMTEVAVEVDGGGSVPPITHPGTRKSTLYLVGPPLAFAVKVYPSGPAAIADTGPVVVPLGLRDLLVPGRGIALDDKDGQPTVSTITDATPEADGKHLRISFSPGLTRSLDPATATLRGNVAKATHGETVKEEVLGDGDAARAFLRFRLAKTGLTHVPRAGAPRGAASTLRVRVNGILWKELPTLLEAAGDAQAFETRMQEDDGFVVQFGDGQTGAPPPTGRKNVVATYRVGVGKAGNVRPGTLSNLLDKPLGLKGATNPTRAHGGSDPESTEAARKLAPMRVRTFGRVVSLRDFEDAALDYAGVTKARATMQWMGGEQVVALTVGGDPDAPLTDETVRDLAADLDARRDPLRKMLPVRYRDTPLALTVRVEVDPRHDPAVVQAAVRRALHDALAYERMEFGQPVNLSDVYAAVHRAEGVVAARVTRLRHRDAADRDAHGAPPDEALPRVPIGHDRLASLAPNDLAVETTDRLVQED